MNPAVALRKYYSAGAVSLRNRLAYPASFAGSLLTYGLFVFIFSRIWATVYADQALIAGYDRSMAVWYFIAAELSAFGFGRFYSSLSEEIKSGQVAYLLARPYDFVVYHFSQAILPALFETGILAVEGALIGLVVAGPPPFLQTLSLSSVIASGFFLSSLLLAGCLQFFLQFAIALTAFWLEENAAFFWIYQKLALIAGTLMPLEFLPDGARLVARFTPFPSLTWAPARLAVAPLAESPIAIIGVQAAWLLAAFLVCRAIFAAARAKISVNGG